MVDSKRGSEDVVTRRAALKGIAGVSLVGTALVGTASAGESSEITFRAARNGTFSFQLVVTGGIETDGGMVEGVVADSDVQVADNVAQGTVSDGKSRRFEFTGEVSVLQVSGRGEVSVDGKVVRDTTRGTDGGAKPTDGGAKRTDGDTKRTDDSAKQTDDDTKETDDRARQTDGDPERLPKEVVVSSPGVDEQLDYVFEVTGDLEKLEPDEDSGNARDEVVRRGDRVRVEGTVGYEDDRFAFSGEFVSVEKPPEVEFDVRDR